jgi:hypothetical protein
MAIRLDAKTLEGLVAVDVDRLPDSCPVCHYAIDAKSQNVARLCDRVDARLKIVFLCPRDRCQSLFISRYFQTRTSRYYTYSGSVPFEPVEPEWPEQIKSISPSFCAIANQAQNAEHQGWKLIAGPGYRKALEFLLKDYLCKMRPADSEKIKSVPLGTCIENYLDNDKIKQVAKRATWLANDETHYTRKWEDKDLEDLKKMMELTVHWIVMEELTGGIVTNMPNGKS